MALEGSIADNLAGILSRLGVSSSPSERLGVEAVADEFLSRRGHTGARVVEVRWKTMLIACQPHTAALLRYDIGMLLEEIERHHPDVVSDIRLRIAA